jgi:hypothetical protein
MNRVAFGLCVAAFVVAFSVFLTSLRQATASCPTWHFCAWRTSPTSDTATTAGLWNTGASPGWTGDLQLNWEFPSIPEIGGAEISTTGSANIVSVAYNPSYFYPTSCVGSVGINASGDLIDDDADGTLESKGWVWEPPYYEVCFHTMTIVHQ